MNKENEDSKTRDLFKKVGFRSNPFNPMGVTRGLDELVPPPVGVRNALTNAIRKLEESTSYKDNIALAVIGEYGSGKSELMKYLFRYTTNQGIKCFFTQFRKKSIYLHSFLKDLLRDKETIKEKSRIIVFIDEIDDIPRMIENNQITKNEADNFFSDIKRFFERNDKFASFQSIMIVLGFGTASWNYLETYHSDISDHRLIGFKIFIPEPENWKMTGLIRRYIYYYADEKLRNLINVENPYYPLTEGTTLALAKLSALAHEHLYVNTRMLIKIMDRILLYLAKKTIKEKKGLLTSFSLEDFKSIIQKPEILGLNEEKFEEALKQINSSLINVAKKLAEDILIDSEILYDILFRIYFVHEEISDDELRKFIEPNILEIFKKKLIEAGVVDELLIIPYENKIEKYVDLVKDIDYGIEEDKYRNVKLIKKYSTFIENDLEKGDFNPASVPPQEYIADIAVKEIDISNLEIDLKELFDSNAKRHLFLSEKRWEKDIREKQLKTIEISGGRKALQDLEKLNHIELTVKFAENLKEILREANLSILETNDKQINSIVCTIDSPKNAYILAKPSEKRTIFDIMKVFLKSCMTSHEGFESITFLIPEGIEQIKTHTKLSEDLINFAKTTRKDRDLPEISVYSFPKKILVHVVFERELHKEPKHKAILKEMRNWVREQQITIRDNFKKQNRIPLDSRKYQKKQFDSLKGLYTDLWIEIKDQENQEKINDLENRLEQGFGELFLFNQKQKISFLERDLIEILMGLPGKIIPKSANLIIKRRYILSCSNLQTFDLLALLVIKGILINNKQSITKNYEFEFYKPKLDEQVKYLSIISSLNELKEKIEQVTTKRIDFLDELHIINLELPLTEQLSNLDQDISILEEIIKDIENDIPTNMINLKGDVLIKIVKKRDKFENYYCEFKARLVRYEEKILNLEEKYELIFEEIKNFSSIYEKCDEKNESKIKSTVAEMNQILSQIDTEKDLMKAVKELKKYSRRISNIVQSKEQFQSFYTKLERFCQELNTYIVLFKGLKSIEYSKWEYIFGNNAEVLSVQNSLSQSNFDELEFECVRAEMPEENLLTNIYFNWMEGKLNSIKETGDRYLSVLYNEVKSIIEPLSNFFDWIVERDKEKMLTNNDKLKVNDINNLLRKINSVRTITGEDLGNLHVYKQFIETFLDRNFKDTKNIVLEIGKEGSNRGVDAKILKEKHGKDKVEKCLQYLLEKGLIIQSITT